MTNNKKILAGSLSLFIFLMLLAPAPAMATWTPKASTTENNTLPTGLPLPSWTTANLTEQNTAPTGVMTIDNNQANGSEVNTQPNGTAANITRNNTGTETNAKPTDSVSINALADNGSENTTQPSGTVANVARDNDGSEVNTPPSGANDPNAQTKVASRSTAEPTSQDADVRPSEKLVGSTIDNVRPTGAPVPNPQDISVDNQAPDDEPVGVSDTGGATENDWFWGAAVIGSLPVENNVVVDDDNTGTFDDIYIDLDNDDNYAEDSDANPLTGTTGTNENDDIKCAPGDNIIIDGIYYNVDVDGTASPTVVYLKSITWAEGSWSVDYDNDGDLETLNFVMIDNNSDDNFDMMVISFDNTYNDPNTADNAVAAGNDENLSGTGMDINIDVDIGAYHWSLTALASQPESGNAAGITMETWYYADIDFAAGPALIDVDNDGVMDNVNLCLWDSNSDGIFDNIDISVNDNDYGSQGSLNDNILDIGDDERLDASENIQIGPTYDFEIGAPVGDPESDDPDFSIKSTSWYYGLIRMDVDGDGFYDNLNFVLRDDNSDGIFDNLEISSDDNTFGELGDLSNKVADTGDDELLGAADNVRIGDNYDFEIAAPVGDPQNDTPDFSIKSTSWFTGTLSIDVDGDDATEAVNFSLSDNNSDGIFNVLEISVGDTDYGENVTSDSAYTDNDARLTGTDNIRIGTSASQSYQYEVMGPVNNPADETDYSVTSTSWWTGVIVLDVDGDGVVDNEVNLCISDSDSNGIFDNLDISSDDSTFGEGTVTDDNAYADNDARIGAADNVRIGTSSSQSYQYEVEFVSNPISGTPTYDFRVTSTSWYEGTLSIDVDDDGTPDTINFCLSDNNSDGVFDNLDISEGGAPYGQDITGENENKVTSTSDVRMNASKDLVFGDYNDFEVMGPVNNPAGDSPDFRVKSKSWYNGGGPGIDVDGDGSLDNVYVCLSDNDSDGRYEILDISAFNDNFGQGTLDDNLIADNLADNNDERLIAATDNLLIGPEGVRWEIAAPVANPGENTVDVQGRAKSWYEGAITLHGGNDFNFVIWDPDSDGVFENLVFDDNQDDNYAGDPQYNSYPVSPVRLPRGSRFAYKVIWFDNEAPPYSDPTYGTNDLVMQPLDTASPTYSDSSPAQGAATSDMTPTISVNLADQATGSYKFDIEPGTIIMKVEGRTVSHSYSGGVVSYTPSEAFSDGEYDVKVSAKDYAKNSASTSWSFYVDTANPSLSLAPGLVAEMTTAESTLEVSGSVGDATGVTVRIWVNNELIATTGTPFSEEIDLSLGSNTIKITATDDAGNTSSKTLRVTRTGAAPVPEARPPEEGVFWIAVTILVAVIIVMITVWKRAR